MSVVSFDLWGTLIKGSPTFGNVKHYLIQKHFPELDLPTKNQVLGDFYVKNQWAATKYRLNELVEQTGFQPTQKFMLSVLLSQINGQKFVDFTKIKQQAFFNDYFMLCKQHLPEVYSEDTIPVLNQIIADGHELIVTSNTMFLPGPRLLRILEDDLGFPKMKYRFSDIYQCSKPTPAIFKDIDFHFGDNAITDLKGSIDAGCKSILINSNDKTIKDAYNFIVQNR